MFMFLRTLFASLATVAAVALAMPVLAQTETTPAAPTPAAKPKQGTTAYCQTLKSASSRDACLKRVQAQAAPKKKPPAKTTAQKTKKKPTDNPPAAMAPATTNPGQVQAAAPPATPAPPQTIVIPPLPQKTI
jgi:hypothetical protein